MENLTSPAARMPYAGIKDNTQEIGLVIVIKMTILKHRSALSASMPPNRVIGFVRAMHSKTADHDRCLGEPGKFFDVINDLVFSAGTETLSNLQSSVQCRHRLRRHRLDFRGYLSLPEQRWRRFQVLETVDWIASLPNWNILFSIPDGMPMNSIFLMSEKSGRIAA